MTILYALLIVPILGILILIHEFGHYWAARRAGIRVEEFGIGIPPRVWGRKRGDTIWSINAIPMGGFVKVAGEDGKDLTPESMHAKTAGQRALFITAGVIFNLITAVLLVAALVMFQGEPRLNTYISEVLPGSPAATAGWQPGDRFVTYNGHEVNSAREVRDLSERYEGQTFPVVIERAGQLLTTTVTPRVNPPADQGRTGIRLGDSPIAALRVDAVPPDSVAAAAGIQAGDIITSVNGNQVTDYLSYSIPVREAAGQTISLGILRAGQALTLEVAVPTNLPEDTEPLAADLVQDVKFWKVAWYQVPVETVRQFFSAMGMMFSGLKSLITGETPLSDVAGPIGMGQLTSEVIRQSSMPLWVTLVNIGFFLSLNLAILNLLPLPALDGGRLVFVILEVLRRGKKVAPEKEGMVHFVGLVVLLALMFVVAFVDIDRIISGNSLLE